ncbi:MAG: chromosome segregation protein SMC, partial [Tissierellia bacterium]|nr:chromosome segregation protein SMC [Tissierellia bacterium]
LALLKEQKKFHIKDIDRLKTEVKDLEKELIDLGDADGSMLEQHRDMEMRLKVLRDELASYEIRLSEMDSTVQSKQNAIEVAREQSMELLNRITDKKGQINGIESFENNINKRIAEIKKQIHILEDEKDAGIDLLRDIELMKCKEEDRIIKYNRLLSDLKLKDNEDKLELNRLYEKINKNKAELQGNISNYGLLKNMQEAYEGYYRSVKNLMLACEKDGELKKRLVGIVADLLKVDAKYERAIDIALGGSLQNVVTWNERDAKFIISFLRNRGLGRVTFLPLSIIKDRSIYIAQEDRKRYGILGLGSELVDYDTKFSGIIGYLLGRIIIVEDLDYAVSAAKRFDYSYRIVTLGGDIINPGGAMTGGSLPKIGGTLLNRKHRIGDLEKRINRLSGTQRELEEQKVALEVKMEKNQEKLNSYEEGLQKVSIEAIKLENEAEKHAERLRGYSESIEKYGDEVEGLNLELGNIQNTREILKREIETLEVDSGLTKKTIEQFMLEFERERQLREELARKATDMQIEVSLLEDRLGTKENELGKLHENLKAKTQLRESKQDEYVQVEEAIKDMGQRILAIKEDMEKTSRLLEDKEKNIKSLRVRKDDLMDELYQQQLELNEINEKHRILEEKRNDWNIKKARYEVRLQGLMERLMENYELEYEGALELLIQLDDLEDAYGEVKTLKRRIKNLGSVNLNSIAEYDNISNRLEFMNGQYDDLISAKQDLQGVILDMEDRMKIQFVSSFDRIAKNFNEVFSILFDGGRANLVLEDEQNILTCGIEIEAQPPGKKLQNLSLLSGGEKALTAVALLFAIFQVKPAPFCVLDEIDAALDESNINRYTNYLKTLSDDIQFIMITHRKGTMEIADVLYGVTMEEEGISKIVSVKLTDDLDELAS